jgi:hypothetical protein
MFLQILFAFYVICNFRLRKKKKNLNLLLKKLKRFMQKLLLR